MLSPYPDHSESLRARLNNHQHFFSEFTGHLTCSQATEPLPRKPGCQLRWVKAKSRRTNPDDDGGFRTGMRPAIGQHSRNHSRIPWKRLTLLCPATAFFFGQVFVKIQVWGILPFYFSTSKYNHSILHQRYKVRSLSSYQSQQADSTVPCDMEGTYK